MEAKAAETLYRQCFLFKTVGPTHRSCFNDAEVVNAHTRLSPIISCDLVNNISDVRRGSKTRKTSVSLTNFSASAIERSSMKKLTRLRAVLPSVTLPSRVGKVVAPASRVSMAVATPSTALYLFTRFLHGTYLWSPEILQSLVDQSADRVFHYMTPYPHPHDSLDPTTSRGVVIAILDWRAPAESSDHVVSLTRVENAIVVAVAAKGVFLVRYLVSRISFNWVG